MASETAQFYAFPTMEALKSVGNHDIPGRLTAPVGWTLPLGQDDQVHFGHIDQAPIIHPAAVQDRASGRPDRSAVSHQTDGSVFRCCTSGRLEPRLQAPGLFCRLAFGAEPAPSGSAAAGPGMQPGRRRG